MRRLAQTIVPLLALLALASIATAQQWSGVLDSARAVTWNPGVLNGIPSGNWTQCGATIAAYSGTAATINNALAACATDTYVLLGPGTFTLSTAISFGTKSYLALRGSGANSTFLVAQSGASIQCSVSGAFICSSSSNSLYPEGYTPQTWTAGYSQGTTQVTLGNASQIVVNSTIIVLNQCDDGYSGSYLSCSGSSTDNGAYYLCQQVYSTTPAGCSVDGPDNGNVTTHRGESEMFYATAVSGETVTLDHPLRNPDWNSPSTRDPQAWYIQPYQYVGVENMTVNLQADTTVQYGIAFANDANVWVSGVRMLYVPYSGIYNFDVLRATDESNYFWHSNASAASPVDDFAINNTQSGDILIDNNIVQQVKVAFFEEGTSTGNVIAYNFCVNDGDNGSGDNFTWGCYRPHASGDNYLLVEGNVMTQFYDEDYHGTHNFNTVFRNLMQGWYSNPTAPKQINAQGFLTDSFNRSDNVVGNLFGTYGLTTVYKHVAASGETSSPEYALSVGQGNGGTSPAIPGDTLANPSILFWGNFDNVTNALRWCGNSGDTGWSTVCSSATEVPLSSPYPLPVPTVGDTTAGQPALPASLFRTSPPAYWGSTPWPAIGPGVTSGNVGYCSGTLNTSGEFAGMAALSSGQCTGTSLVASAWGGYAYAIPAMACALNTMGMPPDGSGGALTFNAATCYSSATGPAVSFSPTSLTFGSQSTGTQSASQNITLTNTGSSTLAISSITLTGTNASDYVLKTSSSVCPASLAAGLNCIISVAFSPTATGTRTANVSVADNASGSPQTVTLTGTGVAPGPWSHVGTATPVHVTSGTTCAVTISPAPVTGNTIWVGAISYNATASPPLISTVKDANGNSLTVTPHSPSATYAATTGGAALAYLLSAPSNITPTITITFATALSGNNDCFADSFQVAGGYTATFDTDAAGNGTGSTSINTPTVTPAGTDVFYSVVVPYGQVTSVNGVWTLTPNAILYPGTPETPPDGNAAAYSENVSSALAVNMTQTASSQGTWDSIEGAIVAVAAGSTPTISSLSATSGIIGSTFTITGTNFGASQGASTAKLNGAALTVTSWGATAIGVTVPSGATTGAVVVTTTAGASNGVTFTVTPNVTGLSVASGPVGTSVTITGTGFTASQGTSTAAFNGASCTVSSWSATSITCPVPAAGTTGNVVVTVGGNASNGSAFTVTPYILTVSPTSGITGSHVAISGTTFGASQGSSTVTFNGVAATCSTWSASSLSCTVPNTATTGNVVVTVASNASNAIAFAVTALPIITSVTPNAGVVGTSVAIAGGNFGATQGTSTVTFGTTTATCGSWSQTSLTCTVPSVGTGSASVVVTTSVGASNGVTFAVTAPGPVITSLTPNAGQVASSVTIAGSNFGSSQGSSSVTFNGVTTVCGTWSATSLVCTVPSTGTGSVVVTTSAGSSNGPTFTVTPPPAPSITGLSPTSGLVGISVTISGTNFGSAQGSSTVTFYNGKAAICSIWSATSLTCAVPSGATTGAVTVTTSTGTSNSVVFTVTAATYPSIDTLSPNAGLVGASVTITGTNFGATQGGSTITFNSTDVVSVTSWSATSIVCIVPSGASTGAVIVTTGVGASNSVTFTVTTTSYPIITSLTPIAGIVGTSVTIAGSNFGSSQGMSTVAFNGTTATSCPTWSATSVVCVVPSGATTGSVVLTTGTGASNGVTYTVQTPPPPAPTITSVAPNAGVIGTTFTVAGSNFGSTQSTSVVTLNGTTVSCSSWGATSLTCTIPNGATSGNVVVTVASTPSNGVSLAVSPPPGSPTISSVSPTAGLTGVTVTIKGANFGATQSTSTVKFNGIAATVSAWSATQITVLVPAGVSSGSLIVTVGGVASNAITFTAIPAIFLQFQNVTITGGVAQ
jgi:hypothetical protein